MTQKYNFLIIICSILFLFLGFWLGQKIIFMLEDEEVVKVSEETIKDIDVYRKENHLLSEALEEVCSSLGRIKLFKGRIEKIDFENLTIMGKGVVLVCWPSFTEKNLELKILLTQDTYIQEEKVDDNCEIISRKLLLENLENEMYIKAYGEGDFSSNIFKVEEIVVTDEDFMEKIEKCS